MIAVILFECFKKITIDPQYDIITGPMFTDKASQARNTGFAVTLTYDLASIDCGAPDSSSFTKTIILVDNKMIFMCKNFRHQNLSM